MRIPKKLRLPLIIAVGVIFFLGYISPALVWDGGARAELNFHLKSGGMNIPNAKIYVIRPRDWSTNLAHLTTSAVTDANGYATITTRCGAGGSVLFGFFKTGKFIVTHDLVVEKPGYLTISTPLANVIGGRDWPISKKSFDVKLIISRLREDMNQFTPFPALSENAPPAPVQ